MRRRVAAGLHERRVAAALAEGVRQENSSSSRCRRRRSSMGGSSNEGSRSSDSGSSSGSGDGGCGSCIGMAGAPLSQIQWWRGAGATRRYSWDRGAYGSWRPPAPGTWHAAAEGPGPRGVGTPNRPGPRALRERRGPASWGRARRRFGLRAAAVVPSTLARLRPRRAGCAAAASRRAAMAGAQVAQAPRPPGPRSCHHSRHCAAVGVKHSAVQPLLAGRGCSGPPGPCRPNFSWVGGRVELRTAARMG